MIIVGGVYQERCRFPKWDRIFGSGLRSAVAISELSPGSELHAYAPPILQADVAATLAWSGVTGHLQPSQEVITFEYLHPFELQGWSPIEPPRELPLRVNGDVVLRFGLMEGDSIVEARRAVYDPQSQRPKAFTSNGSRADELVVIAKDDEVVRLADGKPPEDGSRPSSDDLRHAVAALFDTDTTLRAVLLRDPLGDVTVFQGDEGTKIQGYAAESYFKIGSGDIFASAFAHSWGETAASVSEAADFAARCLAYAVEGPRLPLDPGGIAAVRPAPGAPLETLRIIGGDTLEHQALVLHTVAWIRHLGGAAIVDAEIEEETPHATLILVGESLRARDIERLATVAQTGPTVVYWPNASLDEAQLFFGDAVLARDYATALYRTMRMKTP